jgi:hypothetical protein
MVIVAITKLKWLEKKTFISKWGAHAYNVMPFGLCNAPPTFQKVVTKTFKPYLNKFMQVFLDDFSVYGNKKDHLEQLKKFLKECRLNGISINLQKCAFCVNSGVLLGHIMCIGWFTSRSKEDYNNYYYVNTYQLDIN